MYGGDEGRPLILLGPAEEITAPVDAADVLKPQKDFNKYKFGIPAACFITS